MNVLHCSMLLRSISQFKHIHINPAAQCEVVEVPLLECKLILEKKYVIILLLKR